MVKALGDGFLVVFPAEEPAVRFSISVQRAIAAETWGDGPCPEVRIGMDTGPALYRSDPPDYEGDAVNVASHVCARARPGEVLLSARAFFGARPSLDRSGEVVRLEPVGEVRLKGLPTLEPLYRASAPGLREGYPPLARTGNLAAHLGAPPFIDRQELLREIIDELRNRPVVTLLGPGGMGKTRLATEVGAQLEAEFPAGVWVAPLESVSRGEVAATEVLAALGMPADDTDPAETLVTHLADWPGLLILDNVEQLAEEEGHGFTGLVSRIARRCPRTRLLCTSRVELRLGSSMEARVELPPLAQPKPRQRASLLRDCASIQLCTERLRQRARQFALDDTTAPHVAAICRATDGVPLLIELAAGQLGRRTLPEIARDVERALVVPNRDSDRPDRHRDLSRLLDWSVELLGEERSFFLQLGVFRGGFDAEAAAAVTDESQAEELLQRLVDAHLVSGPASDDYMTERPRYRLLGATAAYCRSRLGERLLACRQRHAAHFGTLVSSAGRGLNGTSPRAAVRLLTEERENLTAAFETALEIGDLKLAAMIGGPLWELMHRLGLWPLIQDGARRLLTAAQAAASSTADDSGDRLRRIEAVAAVSLAQAAHDEGNMNDASRYYQLALDLWEKCADPAGIARALHGLGNASRRHSLEAAEDQYEKSLELATELGDDPLKALNLTTLGLVASGQGRGAEAEERLGAAVRLFRQWDDPWGLAIALNSRARNLERIGQLLAARDLYRESLEIKRELEDRRGMAITLLALARLAPRLGEPENAVKLLLESLAFNRELGDTWGCAVVLGSLAEHYAADGATEQALELAAAGRDALDRLGGGSGAEAVQLDELLRAARSQLPADRAEAAVRRGREASLIRLCDQMLAADGSAGSG